MKLLEYKGKELLSDYSIPVQNGVVVNSVKQIKEKIKGLTPPFVIKAQIMTGGRGKAGGIKFADDVQSAISICAELFNKEIKGCLIKKILIAEKAEINTEWYLSIILDRFYKKPMIIFSNHGGIDIEESAITDPGSTLKLPVNISIGIKNYFINYICNSAQIDNKYSDQLALVIFNLYRLFNEYDCTLAEINPLSIASGNKLTAIDCKIDIDDSSLFRHPDILEFRDRLDENPLIVEARKYKFLYIPFESDGNVSVMSNGSGMLMSCIDLISKNGMKVCSALDLGGGATSDRIREAVKIIFTNKKTDFLLVSIFGGITRCDEVAKGVRDAVESGLENKIVILRLEGTNKTEAIQIMKTIKGNVIAADSITHGVRLLNSVSGGI